MQSCAAVFVLLFSFSVSIECFSKINLTYNASVCIYPFADMVYERGRVYRYIFVVSIKGHMCCRSETKNHDR